MLRPTADQLALLQGFERTAFRIADTVNRRPALKRAAHAFLASVGRTWVHYCTRNLLHVYGLEHLTSLAPDRGVMLVANHRSFFDLYVVSSVLLRKTSWVEGMYFPVRSDYFYERPDGVLVNAVMSAMAMYPPVLRDPARRAFNEYTVDFLAEALQKPGTVVGFHPEGTRNKGEDPYTLLPAHVGAGQIIYRARPIVLPVFVLGLSNDLLGQMRGNFARTGDPITMVFGKPLDLEGYFAEPAKLRTYKRIADRVHADLTQLGEQERAIRVREGFPVLGPERSSRKSVGTTPGQRAA
jgi:1-acyl-sn-glycerol-3-phosphate acyltransferase